MTTTRNSQTPAPRDFSDAPHVISLIHDDDDRIVRDSFGKPIIYTTTRNVSASGMSRIIFAFVIVGGFPISLRAMAKNGAFPMISAQYDFTRDGFVFRGAGMDYAAYLAQVIALAFDLRDGDYSHQHI